MVGLMGKTLLKKEDGGAGTSVRWARPQLGPPRSKSQSEVDPASVVWTPERELR